MLVIAWLLKLHGGTVIMRRQPGVDNGSFGVWSELSDDRTTLTLRAELVSREEMAQHPEVPRWQG